MGVCAPHAVTHWEQRGGGWRAIRGPLYVGSGRRHYIHLLVQCVSALWRPTLCSNPMNSTVRPMDKAKTISCEDKRPLSAAYPTTSREAQHNTITKQDRERVGLYATKIISPALAGKNYLFNVLCAIGRWQKRGDYSSFDDERFSLVWVMGQHVFGDV